MDWRWGALLLLGAYHGINPAMGWLFAVALGLQRRSRRAVLEALGPIALGHAASVVVVVALAAAAQLVLPLRYVQVAGGVALILFGVFKLIRPRAHPKWVGMQVNRRDLVLWSFLMSSAHGAGLMLLPVVVGRAVATGGHAGHVLSVQSDSVVDRLLSGAAAGGLHTLAMFTVMAVVALVVYEKVGVQILRRAWLNLDFLWAGVAIAAGVLTLLFG